MNDWQGIFPQGPLPYQQQGLLPPVPDWLRGASYTPLRLAGTATDLGLLFSNALGLTDPNRQYMGSSDWMIDKAANAGLLGKRTGSLSEMAGDILGQVAMPGVSPTEATAYANALPYMLGIFKGMNANLSGTERDMLAKAFELEQQGMGREAIRQATNPPGGSGGWFRAPWDKKWRMEVDDSAMKALPPGPPSATDIAIQRYGVKPYELPEGLAEQIRKEASKLELEFWNMSPTERDAMTWPLPEKIEHPAIISAYPEMADYRVGLQQGYGVGGSYTDKLLRYGGGPKVGGSDSRSIALHEMQHPIQEIEGMARGGSPEDFAVAPSQIGAARQIKDSATLGADLAEYLSTKGVKEFPLGEAWPGWRAQEAIKEFADWQKISVDEAEGALYNLVSATGELNKAPTYEAAAKIAQEASKKYDDLLMQSLFSPEENYLKLAGEGEARLVQARRDLTPAQRLAIDPIEQMDTMLKSEGILGGIDDLIVRYGDGPAMMDVSHGSPHKWPPEPGFPAGRPRLDKIGTGEGEATFGRGFYSGQAPETGITYANKLAKSQVYVGDELVGITGNTPEAEVAARLAYAKQGFSSLNTAGGNYGTDAKAIEYVKENIEQGIEAAKNAGDFTVYKTLMDQKAAFGRMEEAGIRFDLGGHIYNLDIPDERLPDLLDWDKPLSEQPEKVRNAARELLDFYQPSGSVVNANREAGYAKWDDDLTGAQVRELLELKLGKGRAEAELSAAGIPGLRYLDAASRGAGEGTSNFVIWDQPLLDEMGRRMAKKQGLLADTPAIPDELPFGYPERIQAFRDARTHAALPVEQGGLGLGPANTAAERAAASGADTGWKHGTAGDYKTLSTGQAGAHMGSNDPGVWLTKDDWYSGDYADSAKYLHEEDLANAETILSHPEYYSKEDVAWAKNYEAKNPAIYPIAVVGKDKTIVDDAGIFDSNVSAIDAQRGSIFETAPSFIDFPNGSVTDPEHVSVVLDSRRLRSPFAAFDPFLKNSSDLLASWLLPAAGMGLLGLGYLGQGEPTY